MGVPIGNILFSKDFADCLKFAQRKLYAILQAADLFLSREENFTRNVNPECRSMGQQLRAESICSNNNVKSCS
ncbi:hypothetical protein [Pararhizobium sp. LjRoot235]|uniref:hypothetical protein n=1 Tax=Pararhizobium sp. LjRoot235 TaxID=3342291 RepID=UPI003F4F75B7